MAQPAPQPRGACPTLDDPMQVADGLLARFRLHDGLTPDQIDALAVAAKRFGNDLVEITARGSIQVRGLSGETAAPFADAIRAAHFALQHGVMLEYSPLAGLDPSETTDPTALVTALAEQAAIAWARAPLSPKLSIVVESGGQVALDPLAGDIAFTARGTDWILHTGGNPTGLIAEADAPHALSTLLAMLQEIGPRARGRDLDIDAIHRALPRLARVAGTASGRTAAAMGPLILDDGKAALRIGLPYGQITADKLSQLAVAMREYTVPTAAPAPQRSLVLGGIDPAILQHIGPALSAISFITRPLRPDETVGLCSGAEAAGGAIIHAAQLAQAIAAAAPDLIDGSFHIHVSTCAKGCAYPRRPGLILDGGRIDAYDGAARKPLAWIAPDDIHAAILHLAARIRDSRQPGDTTLDALLRLEPQ